MSLNHAQIVAFKPEAKSYRRHDGNGLYIQVNPNGSKLWRFRYSFRAKPKQIALGAFPYVSLQDARQRHFKAKQLLNEGIDPAAQRKEQKQLIRENPATSFREFATEWHTRQARDWRSRHAENVMARLKADIFPVFGDVSIEKVTPREVIEAIDAICKRNSFDVAKRTLQTVTRVFNFAIGKGKMQFNTAVQCKHLLPKKPKTKHFAAIDSTGIPALLAKIDSVEVAITLPTRIATKLLMLTFVRTKELVEAPWSEFDLDKGVWLIPGVRMKKARDHYVPLARQTIDLLR